MNIFTFGLLYANLILSSFCQTIPLEESVTTIATNPDSVEPLTPSHCTGLNVTQKGVEIICNHTSTIGQYNCSEPQLVGTIAIFRCKNVYLPRNGSTDDLNTMNCKSSGNWSRLSRLLEFKCDPECGRRVYPENRQYVAHGTVTNRTSWPWHVGIFQEQDSKMQYICGGSLILDSVVVTAAHCLNSEPVEQEMPKYRIVLGTVSSNFSLNFGPGVQIFKVKSIYLHEKYDDDQTKSDIATLELDGEAVFNEYVSPVCVPSDFAADSRALQTGNKGDVVGFGYQEKLMDASQTLKHVSIPILSSQDCFRDLGKRLTILEICVGNRQNGERVCQGDSGGGLVFQNDVKSAYYLHGVVSHGGASEEKTGKCENALVFTRVFYYVDWISEKVELITGERRISATNTNLPFNLKGDEDDYLIYEYVGIPRNDKISSVHLQNVRLHQDLLVRDLKAIQSVETIDLDAVELNSVLSRSIRLPNLKSFRLDWVMKEHNEEFLDNKYFTEEFIKSLIFFYKDEDWDMKMISHLKTNIELTLHTQKVFKINHQDGEIVSWLPYTNDILKNLVFGFNLRKLTFYGDVLSLPFSILTSNLTQLRVKPKKDFDFQTIFKKCINLERLHLVGGFVMFNLSDLVPLPLKLRILVLEKVHLDDELLASAKIESTNIETLVLDGCVMGQNVEETFHNICKRVKHLVLVNQSASILNPIPLTSPLERIVYVGSPVDIKFWLNQTTNLSDENQYGLVASKNTNGSWNIENSFKSEYEAHIFIHTYYLQSGVYFSSVVERILSSRLTSHEQNILKFPHKFIFHGNSSNILPFKGIPKRFRGPLNSFEVSWAQLKPEVLYADMEKVNSLESLNLTKVELTTSFNVPIVLNSIKYFKFDIIQSTSDAFNLFVDPINIDWKSMVPITKHTYYWENEEILLLDTIIDLCINGNRLFFVDQNLNIFSSNLSDTNAILKKHAEYSSKNESICLLYNTEWNKCNDLLSSGIKNYDFFIRDLRIGNCKFDPQLIPQSTRSLRLYDTKIHVRNIGEILDHVHVLEKLYLKGIETIVFDDDYVDNINYDHTVLDISSFRTFVSSYKLKELGLQDLTIENSIPKVKQDVRILDRFSLINCNFTDNSMIQNIFEMFPATEYNFVLKDSQFSILETAIDNPNWKKLSALVPVHFSRKNSYRYSENLISLLKKLNLYENEAEYLVFLQNTNRTWTGRMTKDVSTGFSDPQPTNDMYSRFVL